MNWIERLFNQHKLVRRSLVAWSMATITWTTGIVFSDLQNLSPSVAAAYATNTGLLTAVLAFYQWSREKDDRT